MDNVNPLGIAGWSSLLSDGLAGGQRDGDARAPKVQSSRVPLDTRAAGASSFDFYGMARTVATGARLTYDNPADAYSSALAVITPFSADNYWRKMVLDKNPLDKIDPWKLMELMADISPEISRALSDFVLFCNPGFEAVALKPGTDKQDKEAQKALDAMLDKLRELYGSPKVVIDRLFINAALRGALFSETVLDDDGREMVDFVTPDPAFVAFRKVTDPARGKVWQLGQYQNGKFIVLDRKTISYIPIHPLPGRPEGRPLFSAALFSALFLLGVLHDLRRVIQQQGYPRLDIEIDFEAFQESMPEGIAEKPEKWLEWTEALVKQVENAYSGLEPDDAYIHGNFIKVNKQTVGATNSSSLGAIDGLFKAIERMCTRAAKSMPLLMATTDGVSEANANRQWEIYVAFIKSIQQLCETMLEHQFGLMLQAQGVFAKVDWKFAELRAAELLRDAQVELLKTSIARQQYDNGSINAEQMAQKSTGNPKGKADAPAPRQAAPTKPAEIADPANTNADPGSNRSNGHQRSFGADLVALVQTHTNGAGAAHTTQ